MQNSQRVRDAKPRTAVASPHGRWRPTIAPTATGNDHGTTQQRTMPSRAPRRWRGGAIGTSSPTAMPHESGTHGRWAHERREPGGWGAPTGEGARCQAAHRADGAAARWGHRALPPCCTRDVRTGEGARCQAAYLADGAAARWGHRALPQRDRATGDGNGARNAARCQAEHRAVVRKERETVGRFCRLPSNRDAKILSCFPRAVLITLPPISIYPIPRRIQPPLFQWSVHPRTRKPETIRYG